MTSRARQLLEAIFALPEAKQDELVSVVLERYQGTDVVWSDSLEARARASLRGEGLIDADEALGLIEAELHAHQ